ncbi:MAG: outer membrane beta-barrel protein [Bacteroidales bacterium]|nr:outer membrane beta-barrel protein [Bacteroidales bacterium]
MKRFLLLLPALLIAGLLMAQPPFSSRGGQPRGESQLSLTLIDAQTGAPISYATVSIRPSFIPDSTQNMNFSLTDDAGKVILKNLFPGEHILKAELMGYLPVRRVIKVTPEPMDLGKIEMSPDAQLLEQAVVTAVGNPIVVKKDTIEFNSSAVKLSDNDMLEDQLKKLPGFDVSSDGSITYNGETINKIYIDGKTFFLDDPQLATKNLPAKIIEKVRVVEKKSEQAEFTGIDDGESETVLDLSVKKGMMQGWFGNLSAGGGYDLNVGDKDPRFQGGGLVARFTDNSQISIIANGNNTNNRGFRDIGGDMMRSMRASGPGGFGGGGMMNFNNGGITTSWMGGLNATGYFLEDKAMEVAGNYLYNGTERDVEQKSTKTTFQPDGSNMMSVNEGQSYTLNEGHRAGGEIDWKINDNASILFRPQGNLSYGSFQESSTFDSRNDVRGRLNDGTSVSKGDNFNYSTSGRLLYRQRLGKTGRTLSLNTNYSLSGSELDGLNQSTTNYYTDDVLTSTERIDQQYRQQEDAYSIAARLAYTEPLGGNFFLEASYRYNYSVNNSKKTSYNKDADGKYSQLDTDYSTQFRNEFVNQRMQLNLMKQEEKYTAQIGVNLQPATTTSRETFFDGKPDSVTVYKVLNFAPSARFDYNFADNTFLRLRYNGRTSQPSITQLQPVRDNSNPLSIVLGNPNLLPEFSHNLRADFRHTNLKSYASFNANINLSYTMDDIVNANWYDENGVQYSAPVNSDTPSLSGRAFVMFNAPIAKSNFSIMSFTNASLTRSISYSGMGSADKVEDIFHLLQAGKTTNMNLRERLQLIYRNDFLETRLGGSVGFENAWYTIKEQERPSTWSNSVDADVNITLPMGWEIGTDFRYNFYYGYEAGYGDPQAIWNAEISKLLFNDKGTLAIRMYDILNQSKGLRRTMTDNYVQDVQNNTLGQYFMISFTYRFGTFNGNNGGHRGMGPGRGPMGPGGPMRRP